MAKLFVCPPVPLVAGVPVTRSAPSTRRSTSAFGGGASTTSAAIAPSRKALAKEKGTSRSRAPSQYGTSRGSTPSSSVASSRGSVFADAPSTQTPYEERPVAGFGLAMLEKQGWTKGMAVCKNRKAVDPIPVELVPNKQGSGIGAKDDEEKEKEAIALKQKQQRERAEKMGPDAKRRMPVQRHR
ncbi:hypothetical protein KIPB_013287 [Kipferlia bialata]|uniref:Spp2/MOS2 G-patch domain-containing protein n=1 Tax=Kipferlia bialata TaxID=797122 RepID=A0A9K3D7S0_9EUKA|nr:hypothetical protein KIPB_013287 [Kipferlia bialata]|eukprot:g13287.t1